ncbi:MAG TPA: CsbD family protein [Micropepsaceae bacterium]|nr:CsbD family protein [Micropepsaceae bacterium]
MDKDRVKGMAEQGKGSVKETAGKVMGDKKLETEGKVDRAEGKVRNTVGGIKDEIRQSGNH